jgi:hypothetical protein
MSGRPQDSLYLRARTPPPAHPAPNNAGVVLLLIVGLAITAALVLVAPGMLGEIRHTFDCIQTPEKAVCY